MSSDGVAQTRVDIFARMLAETGAATTRGTALVLLFEPGEEGKLRIGVSASSNARGIGPSALGGLNEIGQALARSWAQLHPPLT